MWTRFRYFSSKENLNFKFCDFPRSVHHVFTETRHQTFFVQSSNLSRVIDELLMLFLLQQRLIIIISIIIRARPVASLIVIFIIIFIINAIRGFILFFFNVIVMLCFLQQ